MGLIYRKNDTYNHHYIKVKQYNNELYQVIQFKHPVKKAGFEEIFPNHYNNTEDKREIDYSDEEILRQSLSRTKKTIRDYALCNNFDYFITLTFNRKKYNATDLQKLKKNVGQWLNNYKKRKNKQLKYILIPELHKDKKHFHFHGLMSGIEDITEFKKNKRGNMRYNWISWHNKFGFTSLEKVLDTEAISNYITKYITKDLINAFNKQRFLASKGLKKPVLFFEKSNFYVPIPHDFENEYVRILNLHSYGEIYTFLDNMLNVDKAWKEGKYVIKGSN